MTEMKASEEFVQWIDGALKDGLLSEEEWNVKLAAAASYNLSVEEAKRLVVERCVDKGAVVEHFEIDRLHDLIDIAAPDKLLEAPVQALLRRLAEERYRIARLPSPQAHVDKLVSERLQAAKLREEEPLRQKIRGRLHKAAGPERTLLIEEWRQIYRETLRELGISCDEPSDLVGIFLDCRRELEIEIVEPKPEPPPPPLPQPEPPVPEPPPVQPVVTETAEMTAEPTSNPWISLGGLVLISLAVAVVVFLLLRFVNREEPPEEGASVSVAYPECDDECAGNLKTWVRGLEEDPSPGVLDRAVKQCEPYLELPEAMRRDIKISDPDWESCEASVIVEEFNRLGRASG